MCFQARKKLATWTVEEVCEWLEKQGMETYSETFRQNAIDGLELANITGETLANDLGVGEYILEQACMLYGPAKTER